jgi:hypothetical protein
VTIATVVNYIKTYFPDTPILPTIGNNDVEWHDQAPTKEAKADFYGPLWQIWFANIQANKDIVADQDAYNSWMAGGYFKYTMLNAGLDIFTLNGMYPFYENEEDKA